MSPPAQSMPNMNGEHVECSDVVVVWTVVSGLVPLLVVRVVVLVVTVTDEVVVTVVLVVVV